MPWESEPKGWYAFSRGSSIHIRKGPKNYLADVSVCSRDASDKKYHKASFKSRDLETTALKSLVFLQRKIGKVPVQIDLEHSGEYPVRVRTEEDEVREVVDYMRPIILEESRYPGLKSLLGDDITKKLEDF